MTINYTHPRTEMVKYLPTTASSILDVGCSSGSFGLEIRHDRGQVRLDGIEPNPDAAALAAEIYDHVVVGFFPDQADDLPSDTAYDAIFFNDVLEHMPEPSLALDGARKLLASNGAVIASIPNIRHISVLGPLIVHGEFRYRDSGILDTTHVRFFTRRSIRRFFEESGWRVETLEGLNPVLRIAEQKRRPWIKWLGLLTRGWSDGFFFVQYVVVARPCS